MQAAVASRPGEAEFSPSPSRPARASQGWIRRLWPWLAPHRRDLGVAFGAALVGSAVSTAVPLLERHIVNQAVYGGRQPLWPWLVAMGVGALVAFGASYMRRFVGGRVSLAVQYDLRNAIFDQLQRLDSARHDQMRTGQLVSRANSDVSLLQGLLAFLPIMSGNVLLLVSSLVVMFFLSPLLATVALVVAPALVVGAYRMRESTFPANWDAQQKEGEVAVVVEEAITGVRVVKGFGQERRELERLRQAALALYGSRLRAVRRQALYQPFLAALPALGEVCVLAFGGWLAIDHRLSVGTFLAFATYLLAMAAPARMLSGVLIVAQQARAGAERVLDLLDANPVVYDGPGAAPLKEVRGAVSFSSVDFGYSRDQPVLKGFNLAIAPGETLALVGESGSGKSTVALLLPRFYDVQAGSVSIDGLDVREVTLESLRSHIGVVFEESFLFSDTIRANIAYGRPDASLEEVQRAAMAAEAHEFITELPEGYDTVVGERGLNISGGQRQRIALARALLTDPKILILDDATSAVDAKVEAEIADTLRRIMKGRTTLLIAHRRSSLHLADRIAVVHAGAVVDSGTHEELLGRCDLYRRLISGPGDGAEGAAPGSPLSAGREGTSSQLWPYDRQPSQLGGLAPTDRDFRGRVPVPGGAGLGGGLGAGGGGQHNWAGILAPTPELLAKVASLPPVEDDLELDLSQDLAYDPGFTLRKFLRPLRARLMLGLLLVVLDSLANLAGPLLIREGLDRGVAAGSRVALFVTSVLFLGVVLGDWVDSVAQVRVTGKTAERLLLSLRLRIFAHLQRLSIDFYEKEMAGRLMTRMTTDVDVFSTLLQSGLITAIVSGFTLVGVAGALLVWSPTLAGVALSVVVPLAVATVAYRRASARAYSTARERIAVVNANLQESLSGIKEAQAFSRQDRNSGHFRQLSRSYLAARMRAQRLVAGYFSFVRFLADAAAVLVLAVGSVLVGRHALSAGELVGFLLYLDLFFNPLLQLSQTFDSYQQAGASMAQINQLMAARPALVEPAHPIDPGRIRGEVRFCGVSFSYPGPSRARPALEGVDLAIPAGQTVAVVGQTGAGKSTLVKLLARFYDPSQGVVLIDGHDLRQLDPGAYKRQLGYVPQEAHLFSGTIRDNIAYGRPDASDAEVEAAARAVGAHEIIAGLEGGYLHEVSERGRSLSVGQRQLIALARAQLVDPALLLLDEATSNLDLATEAKVSEAMGLLSQGRTTLVVAHRLPTAARADRIVVLDKGRVVEDGTHAQLLGQGGLYASMWSAFMNASTARSPEPAPS